MKVTKRVFLNPAQMLDLSQDICGSGIPGRYVRRIMIAAMYWLSQDDPFAWLIKHGRAFRGKSQFVR